MASIIRRIVDEYTESNSKVDIMLDLSILEISLIIAIKHHDDIYDRDPFNFEIILTRLRKFQNSNKMGSTDRAVVLKAFDVLKVSSGSFYFLIPNLVWITSIEVIIVYSIKTAFRTDYAHWKQHQRS